MIESPVPPVLPVPPGPLTLRRATVADAADHARIMGDPAVLPGLMQLPYVDAAIWVQRLTETLQPGKTDLPLVALRDGVIVGTAGLHPAVQIRRRHVALLGISVAPHAQGQGVGRALMQGLCDYADGWAQIQRIELTVFADNRRAIRLYESVGFRIEGTHRGYALRDGVYEDVHSMARLHPEPPVIRWPAE
jgi:putative acetyltransferase